MGILEYLKRMRTYAFAAIVAIAVGQDYTLEVAGETALPDATYESLNSKGMMGEAKASFDADNFFLLFWMGWETTWSNYRFSNGSNLQNYAQWEEGDGKYGGFTCNNLNSNKENSWNSNHVINNYTGIDSMANADGGSSGAWDSWGTAVVGEEGWFQADADTP